MLAAYDLGQSQPQGLEGDEAGSGRDKNPSDVSPIFSPYDCTAAVTSLTETPVGSEFGSVG